MAIYFNEKEILNKIREKLNNSKNVDIAVAFITGSGLNSIFKGIDLTNKKIRVVTTTDNYITDPSALQFFMNNKIETKLINKDNAKIGFHSKFIIFGNQEKSGLIGSANITWTALNAKYESMADAKANELQENFDNLWKLGEKLDKEFVLNYEDEFNVSNTILDHRSKALSIKANEMQRKALKEIEEVMQTGDNKALLWAATGSGKTILSALLARKKNFKRTLFIVHNRTIIRNAKRDFKLVFPSKEMVELFTGNYYSASENDFVFSTEKTITKILIEDPAFLDQFDYIIFDEAHKIGENNLQDNLINTLLVDKEKFILAMTATPMRSDDPRYVTTKLENIVGKITPKEALEKGLICKFKYFGVDVIDVDFEVRDLKTNEIKVMSQKFINKLKDKETRIWDSTKIKGILFVKTKKEALLLEEIMNKAGYKSIAIFSGKSDRPDEQNRQIDDLQDNSNDLNFIISINKFNEGVDIPNINTIGMFRFTESNIIYSQQIGRGLRKEPTGKKFLNIIDLVGNHKNSFERIIALNGEVSGEPKDLIHRIKNNTIDFQLDEIASESILESLLETNNVKYSKFYKQILNEKSLLENRPIRLVEYKEKITKNLRLLINNLKPKTTTNEGDKSWLVEAHKAMGENMDSISDIENQIIDLFSWMPIAISTPEEKQEIIKMLEGQTATLKKKWLSYFSGKNVDNESISQMVKGDFNAYFKYDSEEGTISFKRDLINGKAKELLDEVKEYLYSNQHVDDFESLMQWYSRPELLFMQGYTATIAVGKFHKYEGDEDYDQEETYYTNKIYNRKSNYSDYKNKVLNNNTFILSNDKVDTEVKYNINKTHNFIGTKQFNRDYMYLYIGKPSEVKLKDTIKKDGNLYKDQSRSNEVVEKEYTRYEVTTSARLSDEDTDYLMFQ